MKHLNLASSISLAVLSCSSANANLSVSSITFGGPDPYATEGTITDSGAFGSINSVDPFFGQHWYAEQVTGVITSSNGVTFLNTYGWGAYYDYAADIALMTNEQVAVGMYWNWNSANGSPVLAVFDCVTTPGVCVGQTTGQGGVLFGGMQASPFPGQIMSLSGTGNLSAVPVPAAAWLFGSGLIGLVGFARRKN